MPCNEHERCHFGDRSWLATSADLIAVVCTEYPQVHIVVECNVLSMLTLRTILPCLHTPLNYPYSLQARSQQCHQSGACMESFSVPRASFETGLGLAMALGTDPFPGLLPFQTSWWNGMLLGTESQMTLRQDAIILLCVL